MASNKSLKATPDMVVIDYYMDVLDDELFSLLYAINQSWEIFVLEVLEI